MTIGELIQIAREAQQKAYCPYSNFRVGAALLTRAGKVFTGVNVENASYGLTVCAERIAIFKAVAEGERDFQAIVIVGSGTGYIYPCGACLQVLAEFTPEIKIMITDENDNYIEYDLRDLMPQVFSLQNLGC